MTAAKLLRVIVGADHQSAFEQLVGCTLRQLKASTLNSAPLIFYLWTFSSLVQQRSGKCQMFRLLHPECHLVVYKAEQMMEFCRLLQLLHR